MCGGGSKTRPTSGSSDACIVPELADVFPMKGKPADIVVRHNVGESRFEAVVEDTLSVADYQIREREMIMTHTYVPPAMRGRGIAEKLVRAALEHARAEKLRVVPACSYVDVYIQRHPEFQPLVA